MTDLGDPSIASCLPETGGEGWPSAESEIGADNRTLTCAPPDSQPEPEVITSGEEIRLGCETLSRIRSGYQQIEKFPLPKLHTAVAKVPLLGSLFLHIDPGTFFETPSPLTFRNGRLIDGELRVRGNMGVTFSKDKNMEPYGPFDMIDPPFLARIESIRF